MVATYQQTPSFQGVFVELYSFSYTVNQQTLPSSPSLYQITFPDRITVRIDVLIPPGANGNVGFRLEQANTPLIPYNGGFLVSSGERIVWYPLLTTTSGKFTLVAYNTGVYKHTIYLWFYTLPVQMTISQQARQPIQL